MDARIRGLCEKHYNSYRHFGKEPPLRNNADPKSLICKIEDCGKLKFNRALCEEHFKEKAHEYSKRFRQKPKILPGEDELLYCYKCEEYLLPSRFNKDKTRPQGLSSKCKLCTDNYRLIKLYGLTARDVKEILNSQDWKCPICSRDIIKGKWHIDHDHDCCPSTKTCGKCIRGIICNKCNMGLGAFEDNIMALLMATEYLLMYKR